MTSSNTSLLPDELYALIVADSYRVRQLLRLTCKTYHILLRNNIRYVTGGRGSVTAISRKKMIDRIFALINDNDGGTAVKHMEARVLNMRIRRVEISIILHKCSSCGGYLDINSFYNGNFVCCEFHIVHDQPNYDILFMGHPCTLVPSANYTKKYILDHIYDILPELSHVIVREI